MKHLSVLTLACLLALGLPPLSQAQPSFPPHQILVSGGGQYVAKFGLTIVSCQAILRADGSVTGQFEQHNPGSGLRVHGTINRITFLADNLAVLGGTLTHVKQRPDGMWWIAEGNEFAFYIADNGQGAAAPDFICPYLITKAISPQGQTVGIGFDRFADWVEDWLAGVEGAWDPDDEPLKHGNFQVRQP